MAPKAHKLKVVEPITATAGKVNAMMHLQPGGLAAADADAVALAHLIA